MFKWAREIKAIGFKDWLWFVFILKRNEFSEELDISRYYEKYQYDNYLKKLIVDRNKAHNIDMLLKDINNE